MTKAVPNPYGYCKFQTFYSDGRPRPCRSPRCLSPICRAKGAEKQAAILIRSFQNRPPDFAIVLKIVGGLVSDVQMGNYLRTFTQRIRDHRKPSGETIEYDIRVEFTKGRPHCHVTLITSLKPSVQKMKDLVRCWWKASCEGRRVSVYCKRVRCSIAQAKYVTKNIRDRSWVEMPPPGWNGKKCHLVWTSTKFLTESKAKIWQLLITEWYGKQVRETE